MLEVRREALVKTLESKKQEGYSYLKKITAVDHGDSLEVVYILYNPSTHSEEIVKAGLNPDRPVLKTAMGVYAAADWNEREVAEMFGIEIKGRKARRLLLEGWEGSRTPLRKGFVWGERKGVD